MESEVLIALGRIEEQTKHISSMLTEHKELTKERLDDHGKRIASLEQSRAKQVGIITTISVVASGASAAAWKLASAVFGG